MKTVLFRPNWRKLFWEQNDSIWQQWKEPMTWGLFKGTEYLTSPLTSFLLVSKMTKHAGGCLFWSDAPCFCFINVVVTFPPVSRLLLSHRRQIYEQLPLRFPAPHCKHAGPSQPSPGWEELPPLCISTYCCQRQTIEDNLKQEEHCRTVISSLLSAQHLVTQHYYQLLPKWALGNG